MDLDDVPLIHCHRGPSTSSPSSSSPLVEASPSAVLSWAQLGFQIPPIGVESWREVRKEINRHSPSLFNFPMSDLKVADEVGPTILRRASTLDQLNEFKKLSSFDLLGLSDRLFSLVRFLILFSSHLILYFFL